MKISRLMILAKFSPVKRQIRGKPLKSQPKNYGNTHRTPMRNSLRILSSKPVTITANISSVSVIGTKDKEGENMENKNDGIIFNPNLIWLPTPPQMKSAEDFAHIDAFLPGSTGERIEDGILQRYGIGDFTMKIGGTVYDVSTHFSTDGKQSVLQQFRDLLLSQKLI